MRFHCEQPGHRTENCELPALCHVCLANAHTTSSCPFIFYSSNVSNPQATSTSYAKNAESAQAAEDTKKAEYDEQKRVLETQDQSEEGEETPGKGTPVEGMPG